MLGYYFQLQGQLLARKITGFGLPLGVSIILLTGGFVGGAYALYSRYDYASYLLLLLGIMAVYPLAERQRNNFLRHTFGTHYHSIRWLENMGVSLPFIAVFLWYQSVWEIVGLVLLNTCMVVATISQNGLWVMPTPFGKHPYEFAVGFRKSWGILPVFFLLEGIACRVGNPNLGIFSVLGVLLVCATYYLPPDPRANVWNYAMTPRVFLHYKTFWAVLYVSIWILPMGGLLAAVFPSSIAIIAGFILWGYGCFISLIWARYSAFPNEIGVPQIILVSLMLVFPPIMIVIAPYFYQRANQQLKTVLT